MSFRYVEFLNNGYRLSINTQSFYFHWCPCMKKRRNQVLKWYFIELRWSRSHIVSVFKLQSYNCLCLSVSISSLLNYKGTLKGNP